MTACPLPGAVRAALDGERPDVDEHVASCRECSELSRSLTEDARFAASAFGDGEPPVDVDAALAKTRDRVTPTHAEVVEMPTQRWAGLSRVAAGLLVVVLAGAVLATPGGRAAAASFLERFRAERVAVVPLNVATVDPAALEALADVAQLDELEEAVHPREVASLEEAAEVAGFAATPLDTSALPDAAGGVEVLAQAPQTVRVAFPNNPSVPEAIRGSALVLDLPGAVIQSVQGASDTTVAVRGEAGTLEATVEGGPSLGEMRDALLSLPGLPAETVAALRAIEDWETTLPLPVPTGHVAWEETTVAGHPAVAFGDDTGVGSALLWHDGDRFVGVGGMLPLSEVRRLAEEG